MEDDSDAVDGAADRVPIPEVALDESDTVLNSCQVIGRPSGEIIEDSDRGAPPDQSCDQVGADDARSTSDKKHVTSSRPVLPFAR